MNDEITEAFLEMHFYKALIEKFKSIYGANFLKFIKPSQRQEAWVGFDQAWVKTQLSTQELFAELKSCVKSGTKTCAKFYIGYFYQFKKVEELKRNSRFKPESFSVPYFRSEISLKPNATTGLSQHETLLRLKSLPGADVCYACGMLFDMSDLWEEVNIDKLRLVDIATAPSGWNKNQRHFIAFQTPEDPVPYWCSDPVAGKSYSVGEWLERGQLSRLSGDGVIKLIENTMDKISNNSKKENIDNFIRNNKPKYNKDIYTYTLPAAFTLMEFETRI